jgi:pyruvate dehydrogenase complex dehydrogenase (E1) component
LEALARDGAIEPAVVQQAIEKYEIDTESAAPWRR